MRGGRSDIIVEHPGSCTDGKYLLPWLPTTYYGNQDFSSVLAAIVTLKAFED